MFKLATDSIYSILKILLLFLVLLLFISIFKSCHDKYHGTPINDTSTVKVATPIYHTDDSGIIHAQNKVVTPLAPIKGVETVAQASLVNYYNGIIAQLSARLKVQSESINTITQVSTNTSGEFKPIHDTEYVTTGDTSKRIEQISYSDKWISIKGDINDTSHWQYSVNDSLTIVTYQKKTGWFSHELYADAFAQNPNTHIKGLQSIKLDLPKPKKWGIGIDCGYGYNGIKFSPIVSIGIQRTLLRF